MLKRFASPYFVLPSFVLILGLFVPNPHPRVFWFAMLGSFFISYGLAALVTHLYSIEPKEKAKKPGLGLVNQEIPIMIQRQAEIPKNLYRFPEKDKQKATRY